MAKTKGEKVNGRRKREREREREKEKGVLYHHAQRGVSLIKLTCYVTCGQECMQRAVPTPGQLRGSWQKPAGMEP